ncbi:MAG: aldehyde dehydrogenase family protein [Actinomycetota bacterium]|nr:aldehyde dehydrogenase family protein [Actinomycetota bacterium]
MVATFTCDDDVAVGEAVARARVAAAWWSELGFVGRRRRLDMWKGLLARRMTELAQLMHRENGKPVPDAQLELLLAIDHVAWAAGHARKVLGPRRVASGLMMANQSAILEYQPLGVVGVIGPWNYPVFTPMGSIAYALAAGNAVVFKPSEYTPAVGRWLVESFAEAVPEHPVLQLVTGLGDTGAALCRSGVDKIAFTGSARTGRKVMAACAETLTPVLMECGGKDAMIVDDDADVDAAAEAALWGGMSNAGQTCIGIERVYVTERVYEPFLAALTRMSLPLRPGTGPGASYGPITMPAQVEVIRRHIADAVARGGRVVTGGGIEGSMVEPTILVDVPEDSLAVTEETFGPTLTVTKVRTADEGVALANATSYGLAGAVFAKRRGVELARKLRSGMTSVNNVVTFAGVPGLPFGGSGDSGFGRIHGEDGLREFARAKAITRQRFRLPMPLLSFERSSRTDALLVRAVRFLHGRG